MVGILAARDHRDTIILVIAVVVVVVAVVFGVVVIIIITVYLSWMSDDPILAEG